MLMEWVQDPSLPQSRFKHMVLVPSSYQVRVLLSLLKGVAKKRIAHRGAKVLIV